MNEMDVLVSNKLLLIEQELCTCERILTEVLSTDREYRPNAVRFVHTTVVKILPYRPN